MIPVYPPDWRPARLSTTNPNYIPSEVAFVHLSLGRVGEPVCLHFRQSPSTTLDVLLSVESLWRLADSLRRFHGFATKEELEAEIRALREIAKD